MFNNIVARVFNKNPAFNDSEDLLARKAHALDASAGLGLRPAFFRGRPFMSKFVEAMLHGADVRYNARVRYVRREWGNGRHVIGLDRFNKKVAGLSALDHLLDGGWVDDDDEEGSEDDVDDEERDFVWTSLAVLDVAGFCHRLHASSRNSNFSL